MQDLAQAVVPRMRRCEGSAARVPREPAGPAEKPRTPVPGEPAPPAWLDLA